ncbi:hypothetical protein RRG37_04235 [Mycoplasmopsis felis]|nr:hypothetical protein [Mycoplasmopsis felis]WQQ03982.1 hypothetical protein RRG47_00220 [Mycoplasmopsis felis]WQQ06373.1 hypothetical protein RRG40_00865 [Mycoplasmopsis felis]WQQ11888.1 hypothetical protein RRG50_01375 [Mycoplasmopsis felis]
MNKVNTSELSKFSLFKLCLANIKTGEESFISFSESFNIKYLS